MSIYCFGLSHQTATVDVLERFAISESALPEALERLKRMPGLTEGLILSTCNRTEFYVTGEFQDSSAPAFFESFYRYFLAGDETHLFRLWANHCVRHLFQVTSGLESMVVGETEIFGQVKRAYEFATGAKTTGKLLNRLFQKSFQVGKQVRSSTAITRGNVSAGSVAVDLAEQIFGDLDGCKIMILGAGETSEKTAKAFGLAERNKFLSPIALSSERKLWRQLLADEQFILRIGSKSFATWIYWSVRRLRRTRSSPWIS